MWSYINNVTTVFIVLFFYGRYRIGYFWYWDGKRKNMYFWFVPLTPQMFAVLSPPWCIQLQLSDVFWKEYPDIHPGFEFLCFLGYRGKQVWKDVLWALWIRWTPVLTSHMLLRKSSQFFCRCVLGRQHQAASSHDTLVKKKMKKDQNKMALPLLSWTAWRNGPKWTLGQHLPRWCEALVASGWPPRGVPGST